MAGGRCSSVFIDCLKGEKMEETEETTEVKMTPFSEEVEDEVGDMGLGDALSSPAITTIASNDTLQEDSVSDVPDRDPKPGYLYTSIILILLNIFNYCDRFIPSSTKDLIKNEWDLTDEETGRPALVFLLAYMLASPIFATIVDKGFSRKIMLGFGITIWSISSAAAFFAQNFGWFLFSRVGVGFGMATRTSPHCSHTHLFHITP
eukprot:TRINITY_DN3210_c2_g1_i1.p1 TRINITY_DN3210_c2_g1~~TRINITY_DN3210_c2_g1_i1.p1  ORF type:complete len:205 (-),score=25.92 TRINITY_DN3210_c2_g1_i1:49-663(-)